jgi:hypothetical protein
MVPKGGLEPSIISIKLLAQSHRLQSVLLVSSLNEITGRW